MDVDNLVIGNEYFTVVFYEPFKFEGGIYNIKNYSFLETKLLDIQEKTYQIQRVKSKVESVNRNLKFYKSVLQAKQATYANIYNLLRDKVVKKLGNDELPELILRPNMSGKMTSNPLRMTERNTGFYTQTNAWGNEINPQKIILLLAVTWEDISMFFAVLNLIPFVNDYAKKLIGKSIVIELNNLFALLRGTQDCKGLKDFNPDYRNKEFKKLTADITDLEKKYGLKGIRDSLAAHKLSNLDVVEYSEMWDKITRASLKEYCDLFNSHWISAIEKYYPNEFREYFTLNLSEASYVDGVFEDKSNDYETFDIFEM
jgi:hypothetical protein